MNGGLKALLFGCGSMVFLGIVGVVVGVIWLARAPEPGVKMANEMDEYALEYIAQHNILEPGENLVAYYDATVSMNGKEAAILTTSRVLYHKNNATTAMDLADVVDVSHRNESLLGDTFEISSVTGEMMKIEIAPLNNGATFKTALMGALEANQSTQANRTTDDGV